MEATSRQPALRGASEICTSDGYMYFDVVCLFGGCFTPQQHIRVSQVRAVTMRQKVADQTLYVTQSQYLSQSQYTDTGPTGPSADPMMPGAWQGSHWRTNF